jgi:hypothetical protein
VLLDEHQSLCFEFLGVRLGWDGDGREPYGKSVLLTLSSMEATCNFVLCFLAAFIGSLS